MTEPIIVICIIFLFGIFCLFFPNKFLAPIDELSFLVLKVFPWLRFRDRDKDLNVIKEEWKNHWIHKIQLWYIRIFGILAIMIALAATIVIITHQ